MINPYVCSLCKEEGKIEPAWFLVHFSSDGEPVPPLPLCERCFIEYTPTEYSSIENLRITLEREGGCCQ